MNREVHVRFCEGLGCNSFGLLTSFLPLFEEQPVCTRAEWALFDPDQSVVNGRYRAT
jgi:hypothetical protein